jgi:hypothetical protein
LLHNRTAAPGEALAVNNPLARLKKIIPFGVPAKYW